MATAGVAPAATLVATPVVIDPLSSVSCRLPIPCRSTYGPAPQTRSAGSAACETTTAAPARTLQSAQGPCCKTHAVPTRTASAGSPHSPRTATIGRSRRRCSCPSRHEPRYEPPEEPDRVGDRAGHFPPFASGFSSSARICLTTGLRTNFASFFHIPSPPSAASSPTCPR